MEIIDYLVSKKVTRVAVGGQEVFMTEAEISDVLRSIPTYNLELLDYFLHNSCAIEEGATLYSILQVAASSSVLNYDPHVEGDVLNLALYRYVRKDDAGNIDSYYDRSCQHPRHAVPYEISSIVNNEQYDTSVLTSAYWCQLLCILLTKRSTAALVSNSVDQALRGNTYEFSNVEHDLGMYVDSLCNSNSCMRKFISTVIKTSDRCEPKTDVYCIRLNDRTDGARFWKEDNYVYITVMQDYPITYEVHVPALDVVYVDSPALAGTMTLELAMNLIGIYCHYGKVNIMCHRSTGLPVRGYCDDVPFTGLR